MRSYLPLPLGKVWSGRWKSWQNCRCVWELMMFHRVDDWQGSVVDKGFWAMLKLSHAPSWEGFAVSPCRGAAYLDRSGDFRKLSPAFGWEDLLSGNCHTPLAGGPCEMQGKVVACLWLEGLYVKLMFLLPLRTLQENYLRESWENSRVLLRTVRSLRIPLRSLLCGNISNGKMFANHWGLYALLSFG